MTRQERLALKYALIKNTYQDTSLAHKAKFWSWERINLELGIDKPSKNIINKGIELKDYSEKTVKQKQNSLKKVKFMKEKGFIPDLITKYKNKSFKSIENNVGRITIGDKVYEVFWSPDRKERYEAWRYWSQKPSKNMRTKDLHYMPYPIRQSAYEVNLKSHTDSKGNPLIDKLNSRFGFAGIYNVYVLGMDIEKALKVISPSDVTIREYVYNVKV